MEDKTFKVSIEPTTLNRIDAVIEHKQKRLGVSMTREHQIRTLLEIALEEEESNLVEN